MIQEGEGRVARACSMPAKMDGSNCCVNSGGRAAGVEVSRATGDRASQRLSIEEIS